MQFQPFKTHTSANTNSKQKLISAVNEIKMIMSCLVDFRYFGVQDPDHDGNCGPTNGPNCPACRVLKTDRVERLWRKGKWQGWTGMVYCGRYFGIRSKGHDGYCGPNNGPNCPECHYELLHN